MAKFVYFLKGAFINFDAMDRLGIDLKEYAFLESIHLYQQNSGTGWAGPGLANNYPDITTFKQKVANRCGLKIPTMYRLIARMRKKGYLEEKTSCIRVTDDFRIALGVGKRQATPEEENTPPMVETDKIFYADSVYMEFEPFKKFVNESFPNEKDLDIEFYYNQIKTYYTTENGKAYKNWEIKICEWIKRQIRDGDVVRIKADAPQSTRTNDKVIEDLRTGYAKCRNADIEPKTRKTTVQTYVLDCQEAEKRGITPQAAKDDLVFFTALLAERGGVGTYFEKLKYQKNKPPQNETG